MTTTVQPRPSAARPAWQFTRHLAEMVVAMLLGMATLYPMWLLAGGDQAAVEVDLLVMATAMTVPMVAWMRHRRHGVRPTVEMAVAMYAGFVVLFPFYWAGAVDEMGMMAAGHVLMPVFMLAAMLARRSEYASHH